MVSRRCSQGSSPSSTSSSALPWTRSLSRYDHPKPKTLKKTPGVFRRPGCLACIMSCHFFIIASVSHFNLVSLATNWQIENLHVRYEDGTSDPSRPFSAGVTLESIELSTADIKVFTTPRQEPLVKKQTNTHAHTHTLPLSIYLFIRLDLVLYESLPVPLSFFYPSLFPHSHPFHVFPSSLHCPFFLSHISLSNLQDSQ
jgi:hypothetical protein